MLSNLNYSVILWSTLSYLFSYGVFLHNCANTGLLIRINLFTLNKIVYYRVLDSEITVSILLMYQKLSFDPFHSVCAGYYQCSFLQQRQSLVHPFSSWMPLFSDLCAFQGALRPLSVHIGAISASETTAFLIQLLFGLVSCTVKMVCIRAIINVPWQRDNFFTHLCLLSLTSLCEGSWPVNIPGRNVKILAMS